MKKNMMLLWGFLLILQVPVFAETLYPAKILRGTGTVYQNDLLIIKCVGKGWKWSSLYFSRYNIEENSVTSLGSVNGNYLIFYISDEERLVAHDIVDWKNNIYEDYVFNEEKTLFEKVDYHPLNYILVREVPDAVSEKNKNPGLLWEQIGNYYIKLGPWQDEKSSFVVVDLVGNYINTIPIYTYPEVMSEPETIRTSKNNRYLYLSCYLSIDCTDIDNRLNKDNFISVLYELIPDNQVPFATTEFVEITEVPSDTEMPAYKVTTRTVDASSLIVPLKPDARILKAADNLRLRKSELTSSDIVTTMLKGTPVKIIATGRKETIDGITGNWVQVEVLSGGKDRNGNPIPAGTTGWCFGGYLE